VAKLFDIDIDIVLFYFSRVL